MGSSSSGALCKFHGCNRTSIPMFRGYCSSSHRKLDKKKPQKHVILFCASCDTPVKRLRSQVSKGGKAYCTRCGKNSGESHPNWKDGQYINAAGYRVVMHKKRYVLEHRHTWEQGNNSCILPSSPGTVAVHHINMNKLDNRPANLLLLSAEEHGRIHRLMDAGKYDEAKCKLLRYARQQAYFLEHTEHLDHIVSSSLQSILSST